VYIIAIHSFLAPAVYKFGTTGLSAIEPSEYFKKPKDYKFATLKERLIAHQVPKEAGNFVKPPFDLYCPSMVTKIDKCICEQCGQYWPCMAAVKRHAICHKNKKEGQKLIYTTMEVSDEFSKIQEEESDTNPTAIPVIQNLWEFLKSPFYSLDDPIDGIML
jgi:hypothetical protein